jgi:hypothetical protein
MHQTEWVGERLGKISPGANAMVQQLQFQESNVTQTRCSPVASSFSLRLTPKG